MKLDPGRALALAALLIAPESWSCAGSTTIAEIHADRPTYDGKSVTLEWELASRLSLIPWKTYVLNDGTGEITVVTKKALPNVGARMTVSGRTGEGFSLGSQQTLVLIDESA